MSLLNVAKNGTYYNPAYKHYGYKTNVVCDRCSRSNLSQCIGLDNADLCLKCVEILSGTHDNKPATLPNPVKRIQPVIRQQPIQSQPQSQPQHVQREHNIQAPLTRMQQGMFERNQNKPANKNVRFEDDMEMKTYMEQDMFKGRYYPNAGAGGQTMFGNMDNGQGDQLVPNEYDDNDMYMSVNPKPKKKSRQSNKTNNDYIGDLFEHQ